MRCGCPSIDRKVVNSGKRLRAYVGLDEGEVTYKKICIEDFSWCTAFLHFNFILNILTVNS